MKMKRGVLVQVVGKEAGVDRLNPPPPQVEESFAAGSAHMSWSLAINNLCTLAHLPDLPCFIT